MTDNATSASLAAERPARVSTPAAWAFRVAAGVAFIGSLLFAAYFRWAPPLWQWNAKYRAGQEAVARVERYCTLEGHLPATLADVGLPDTDTGPIYYRRDSDGHYILWFGTTLGESVTYDSRTRRWE